MTTALDELSIATSKDEEAANNPKRGRPRTFTHSDHWAYATLHQNHTRRTQHNQKLYMKGAEAIGIDFDDLSEDQEFGWFLNAKRVRGTKSFRFGALVELGRLAVKFDDGAEVALILARELMKMVAQRGGKLNTREGEAYLRRRRLGIEARVSGKEVREKPLVERLAAILDGERYRLPGVTMPELADALRELADHLEAD